MTRLRSLPPFLLLFVLVAACGDDDDGVPFTDMGPEADAAPSLDGGPADGGPIDGGPMCEGDETLCGDDCVDLEADDDHCGACGNECPAGRICSAGSCEIFCPGEQVACGDECVSLDSNAMHCGACDAACEAGEGCDEGACVLGCPGAQIACGDVCVDPTSDARHCGACGTVCDAGNACIDGSCTLVCAADEVACGGVCVDPTTDGENCGACGNACGASEICTAGACELTCPGVQVPCAGSCVDTGTDRAHCGACGNACATGEVCMAGACELSCPGAQTPCSGSCVDTLSDPANCGGCGTACGAGEACVGGTCMVTCPSGQAVCGSTCHDLQTDGAHCGSCGNACTGADVCMGGTCQTVCSGGTTECSGSCVDTNVSVSNCGSCGNVCAAEPSSAPFCASGSCRLSCNAGQGDCNADLGTGGNGCETNLQTDPLHCGGCARECMLANATAGCTGGGCVVAACDAGFGDCDTTAGNGCETPLGTDTHCGSCGDACGGTETCSAGACATRVGDTCATAFALSSGSNSVDWLATTNDYLTGSVSCTTFAPAGPDVVLSYTATLDGILEWSIDKPDSTRWAIVVSDDTCGDVTTPLACESEFGSLSIGGRLFVTTGTTYYFYVVDTESGANPLSDPLGVSIDEYVPPCQPGMAGMIGNSVARLATTGTSFVSEYYVAPDSTGNVYVGGTSSLYRIPAGGGAALDVELAASLTTSELGYDMLVDGNDVYVLDSVAAGSDVLHRISTDGGASWIAGGQDYASFATLPVDGFRGIATDGTSIFMITQGTPTEIWSVPAGQPSAPNAATRVGSIASLDNCSGLTLDDSFFYTVCAGGTDSVVRIDRATLAVTSYPVPSQTFASSIHNSLAAHDSDGDGVADFLYYRTLDEETYFVCGMDTTPYTDVLATWGTGTGYGLGFVPTGTPTLFAYDDLSPGDLIRIR